LFLPTQAKPQKLLTEHYNQTNNRDTTVQLWFRMRNKESDETEVNIFFLTNYSRTRFRFTLQEYLRKSVPTLKWGTAMA
jgi:hypothetical protein